ncbi:MAG: hypothetical protein IAE80_10335 [Anaerolinea sp.]|nr:hypothetical protein [Anaerolinea sp.]
MVFLKKAACLLLFVLFTNVLMLSAQDLSETYEHPDGEFFFDYDPDWHIELNDDDTVDVDSDDFFMTVSPPSVVETSTLSDAADTDELIDMMIDILAEQIDFERPRSVEFDSGLTGTRVYFSTGSGRDQTNGVIVAVDLDGRIAILLALGDPDPVDLLDSITPLIDTLRLGGGGKAGGGLSGQIRIGGGGGTSGDLELTAYDPSDIGSQWEAIVGELEDLDLIGTRGELLHEEEILLSATTEGMDTFSQTRTSEYHNFVIGALISYRPSNDESLFCGFLSNVAGNINSSDNIPLLFVGAGSDDSLIVLEGGEGDDDVEFFAADETYDWYDPVHLVMILNDDVLTVFVDGQPAITDYGLTFPPDEGTRVSAGVNLDSSCVMTGYFVYGAE